MIEFVSTFPPIMCGIGTYTKYLVSHMPLDAYRVISFKLDDFFWFPEPYEFNGQVLYELSLKEPTLPASLKGRVIWFQHAFGIWGENPFHFLRLLEDGKKRDKKVVASFHTIHFQSPDTDSGMGKKRDRSSGEGATFIGCLHSIYQRSLSGTNQSFFPIQGESSSDSSRSSSSFSN